MKSWQNLHAGLATLSVTNKMYVMKSGQQELFEVEDSKHLIFRCPLVTRIREEMFNTINDHDACQGIGSQVLNSATNRITYATD